MEEQSLKSYDVLKLLEDYLSTQDNFYEKLGKVKDVIIISEAKYSKQLDQQYEEYINSLKKRRTFKILWMALLIFLILLFVLGATFFFCAHLIVVNNPCAWYFPLSLVLVGMGMLLFLCFFKEIRRSMRIVNKLNFLILRLKLEKTKAGTNSLMCTLDREIQMIARISES